MTSISVTSTQAPSVRHTTTPSAARYTCDGSTSPPKAAIVSAKAAW